MSRKNVTKGTIKLHPGGIPHGRHPGAVQRSIGAKELKELAVMVDTFHPLMLTMEATPGMLPCKTEHRVCESEQVISKWDL